MTLERNLSYDLIRLLGLLVIMIAHSNPPSWIFQLRNFGAPLLIIGSALTYALIFAHRKINIGLFLRRRFGKLIIPAWIFLTVFFVFFYFLATLLHSAYPFSNQQILGSYLFYGGIDFLWILQVYMVLAVITPAAVWLNRKVNSNFRYFTALLVAYAIYEGVLTLLRAHASTQLFNVLATTVLILVPYTIVYLYGFRLAKVSQRTVAGFSFLLLVLTLVIMVYLYLGTGSFVETQRFKYPPQLYYLAYALFAANAIYLICTNIKLHHRLIERAIIWLSANSLWIYLWHILAFYVWEFILGDIRMTMVLFVIKTGYLLSFAISLTATQIIARKRIKAITSYLAQRRLPLPADQTENPIR